jgi:hypothetical protein
MTGTSARNPCGIFKTKRAKLLAIKYSFDLYNKNAYMRTGHLVLYSDVKFIVDLLWIDHFNHGTKKPIEVSDNDYCDIRYYIQYTYPNDVDY